MCRKWTLGKKIVSGFREEDDGLSVEEDGFWY